ncbi:MAG: hypothetical protein R3345_06820 [Fulvivirga sp.]|nr:hypothetical protein [Fulvivirga sp.]
MQITYIQLLYALVLTVNLFALIFLIFKTKKSDKDQNKKSGDDDEGGIEFMEEPELDLPPGVVLPVDSPVKEKSPIA